MTTIAGPRAAAAAARVMVAGSAIPKAIPKPQNAAGRDAPLLAVVPPPAEAAVTTTMIAIVLRRAAVAVARARVMAAGSGTPEVMPKPHDAAGRIGNA